MGLARSCSFRKLPGPAPGPGVSAWRPPRPTWKGPPLLWGKAQPAHHLRRHVSQAPGQAGWCSAQSTLQPSFGKPAVSPGTAAACSGAPSCFGGWSCAWTRSSLAISSISLWQNKCLYITFKGGFCLKNLSEQTCWGHAGEGVSEWAPLTPLAWACSGRRGS